MEIVTKIAPIALALIMLGLGLGLTIKEFLRVINNPKDFLVGFICQLILLPIVASVKDNVSFSCLHLSLVLYISPN